MTKQTALRYERRSVEGEGGMKVTINESEQYNTIKARDFLQGQLTNDINRVTPDEAQLSAWCTPKGRMLALMLILSLIHISEPTRPN